MYCNAYCEFNFHIVMLTCKLCSVCTSNTHILILLHVHLGYEICMEPVLSFIMIILLDSEVNWLKS